MKNVEQRRYEARMSFYTHLIIFVPCISVLAGINFRFSPSVLWILFVLLGWGSGLLIHGLAAFWPLETRQQRAVWPPPQKMKLRPVLLDRGEKRKEVKS